MIIYCSPRKRWLLDYWWNMADMRVHGWKLILSKLENHGLLLLNSQWVQTVEVVKICGENVGGPQVKVIGEICEINCFEHLLSPVLCDHHPSFNKYHKPHDSEFCPTGRGQKSMATCQLQMRVSTSSWLIFFDIFMMKTGFFHLIPSNSSIFCNFRQEFMSIAPKASRIKVLLVAPISDHSWNVEILTF